MTLRRSGSAEKLGLTVCYSSAGSGSEDADTEVYISEIVPESLAARDGRLREGDQILRVYIIISTCIYSAVSALSAQSSRVSRVYSKSSSADAVQQ